MAKVLTRIVFDTVIGKEFGICSTSGIALYRRTETGCFLSVLSQNCCVTIAARYIPQRKSAGYVISVYTNQINHSCYTAHITTDIVSASASYAPRNWIYTIFSACTDTQFTGLYPLPLLYKTYITSSKMFSSICLFTGSMLCCLICSTCNHG